jgi:hypothetical protein
MSENLRHLAEELTRVDAAISEAPLFSEPGNPASGFSDVLVELAAEEERIVGELAREARDLVEAD